YYLFCFLLLSVDSSSTLVRMLNGNTVQNNSTKIPTSQQPSQINSSKVIQ
ncbi:unnamed protein product, partial [Rotaria sp. Silwood2]